MNNGQLINQDSGNYEYYTPSWIIKAAREVMEYISLDPASSEKANKIVLADTFATIESDSLNKSWYGNIWLNPPFSRKNNPLWISKLLSEYTKGNVRQACCITYASTSEKWFQPLMIHPQCYIKGRVNYIDGLTGKEKKGVTKGPVVTYLGPNEDKFYQVFKQYGRVMLPYDK